MTKNNGASFFKRMLAPNYIYKPLANTNIMTKEEFIDAWLIWNFDHKEQEQNKKDLNELINEAQEDYIYCPYCGTELEHELYTDANSKLVCKSVTCYYLK